jgi:hypothetical protein
MCNTEATSSRDPALERGKWSLVALAALLFLASPAGASPGPPDAHRLHLAAGAFDPLDDPLPTGRLPLRSAYAGDVRGGYAVQFEAPITAADRRALERSGATIGGSLPLRALEVVMNEEQRARVAALPGVRWVGPYQAGWKISPRLLDGLVAGAPARAGRVVLRVGLFAGSDEEGIAQLRRHGARILHRVQARAFSLADIEIPVSRLESLLALPLVRHVQSVPARVPHNDRARLHMGLTAVADDTFASGLDPSLDGLDNASGFQVKYGHTDGGIWTVHPDFQDGVTNGRITWETGSDLTDPSGHGTHTAGSLIADGSEWASVPAVPPASGSVSVDRWRGVQPEAALHHLSSANAIDDRHIFETHARAGAQILTNSWGLAECDGIFCPLITDYDASAALWDEGVWDADDDATGQQPLVVFFAAGNAALEQLNGCPLFGGRDNITSPGTAKNVITIGASETDRACGQGEGDHVGDVLFASSRGPIDPDATGQGLFKPDLLAIGGAFVLSTERDGTGGTASASGFDDPSYCSDTGPTYRYEGGTSMACPLAAGAGGVLLQDLVVNHAIAAPKPSLVKALLVNGALAVEPSGSCGYGFETDQTAVARGWGLVETDTSMYGATGTPGLRDVAFENEVTANALATGESHQVVVPVGAGETFKVTLVWTDYPASPGAGSPLVVNDLDLEVSGSGAVFFGNNFDPMNDDWSAAAVFPPEPPAHDTPDRYNVVENVFIQSPAGGSYTITVRAEQVSQDQEPDLPGVNQDFSLVWSTASIDAVPLPEPKRGALLLAGVVLLGVLPRPRARAH